MIRRISIMTAALIPVGTAAMMSLLMLSGAACSPPAPDEPPVLKELFRGKFLIGAALNDDAVSGRDPRAAAIAVRHCNSITAENVMKWEHIHPAQDTYDFGPADRFVAFGEEHGMFIVGHTLIWQSQTPDRAFTDPAGALLGREAMLARMEDHITTIMTRYRGKVRGWDVVNEALGDDGTLLETKWVQTVGVDFVAKAFEFAGKADPGAELYYNDFSLDKPAKHAAVARLVRDLRSRGLRIDGVGIQGHWGMEYPTRPDFDAFMDTMKALGMKVMVTEMDLDILPVAWNYSGADVNVRRELNDSLNPYQDGLPAVKQTELANRYAELFTMLLDHAGGIDRVTFWGVYDKTSWLNNWPVRGRTSYPLLFDRDYKPKPAFDSVVSAARNRN